MIFTKGAHESAEFQNFDCSGESSPNLYSLYWKYIKFQPKKYRVIMSDDTEEWCKIWRKTYLFQKWQEFGEFLSQHSKVSKIYTLIGPLHAKYITFDLKKVQRSYLSWHWRVMQNLKKNWLVVWKMTWGIWQISTRTLESVKLGLWWDPFVQNRKCMS